ncbi:transposase tnp2 [Pyrus ussuriensis x Pyrus communis]|uniref:Transposase tnp2 n=1 Tax=Pyrus ussuriensis x Pyrus communis TaxID=2448454 RepID=A0A5N5IAK1_9ROSA|nr:transposase tnp2 [Pyrus ussuriensis x Pyrus communis]
MVVAPPSLALYIVGFGTDSIGPTRDTYYNILKFLIWKPNTQTNYNLEDMNEDMLVYLNRLFFKCYEQWKSDLHQYFQQFDDLQVAITKRCPKEFEDRQDSWVWLCGHFQEAGYVESASQLPSITPIESMDPPEDARFHILTETLDQTFGQRLGTYCRGMENARRRESGVD